MFYHSCKIDEKIFEKETLPKVSIVTPSYNQAKFLNQTIQSVLIQDYPNIEYIIIDGGSSDGSLEIIQTYADRLSYWVSEPDNGQSHAINKGFAKATGDIFYWLNSDDLLVPSAVRVAVACLLSNPDVGMIYGDRMVIDEKGNCSVIQENPSFSKRWMKYNLKIPQETAFFRKELFHQVGGIDESLHYCMDYDLWIRFSRVTKIYHIPFVLGIYRNHQDAKSIDVLKMRAEIRAVMLSCFGTERRRMLKKIFTMYESLQLWQQRRSCLRKMELKRIMSLIHKPLR